MTDRWFYVFIFGVALISMGSWCFFRQADFVREHALQPYYDAGAVVGISAMVVLIVQRMRGAFDD